MSSDVIIGGGVSALIASLCLSKPVLTVTRPAKRNPFASRILVSGNGRCNFFNSMLLMSSYKDTFLEPYEEIVHDGINYAEALLSFLKDSGISWYVDGCLYYPFFNRAKDFYDVLMNRLVKKNNRIIYGEVVSVDRANHVITYTENGETKTLTYDRVMLDVGGISYDRESYGKPLVYSLGIPYTPFSPSLCPVKVKEKIPSSAVGQRLKGRVSLLSGGETFYSEEGEVLFKKDGLSGIAVFNATHFINERLKKDPGASFSMEIDYSSHDGAMLSPESPLPDFVNDLKKTSADVTKRTLLYTFEGFYPFKDSQVSSGGLQLDVIDGHTMSLKDDPSFFAAGECIDASLPCGGFNIGTAMIEGLKIGKNWEERA